MSDTNVFENNNTANETEGGGNEDDPNKNIDNGFSLATTDVIVTYRVASNYAGEVGWNDIEDAIDFINDFVLRQLSSSVLFNDLSASVVSVTTDRQEPCGVFGNSLSIQELKEANLDLYCFMLESTVTLQHPPSFEKELVRIVALSEVQSQITSSGAADFFKISVDFYEQNNYVSVGIIMNAYGATNTMQDAETQHIFENRTLEYLNYATPMAESGYTVDHVLIREQYLTNVPSPIESDEVEEKSNVRNRRRRVRRTLVETTKSSNSYENKKIMLTLKTLIIGSWVETSSKSSSSKSTSFEDAVLESLITAPYPLAGYLRDTEQSTFQPIQRIEVYSLVDKFHQNQTEFGLVAEPSSQTHYSLGAEGIVFILLVSHVVVIFSGLLYILQRTWREGFQPRRKFKTVVSNRGRSRKLPKNTNNNNEIDEMEMFEDEPLPLPIPLEKDGKAFPVLEVFCVPNEFYEVESTTVTEPLSKGTMSRSEDDDITIPDEVGRKETLKSIEEQEEGVVIPVGQEAQSQPQQQDETQVALPDLPPEEDKQVVWFPDLVLDSPDNNKNDDIADVLFPDVFNQSRSTLLTKEDEAPWFGEPSVRETDFDPLAPAVENQALLTNISEHDATL